MKKKIFCLMLLICVICTGCNSNKEEEISISDEVDNLLKNEEVLKDVVMDEYYDVEEDKLVANETVGVVGNYIFDYNNDDVNDEVVFRLDNGVIYATLYEIEEKELKEVYSFEVIDEIFDMGIINIDIFVKEIDDETYFYLEDNNNVGILNADGSCYNLISFTFGLDKENIITDAGVCGSAITDEEINDYISKVNISGVAISDIDTSVYEQNNDANLISNIERRDFYDDYRVIKAITKDKLLYGVTYINYFDKTNDLNNYVEKYIWEENNDTIYFSLSKENDGTFSYYIGYYINGANHASEEQWGTWEKDGPTDNTCPSSLAEYTFSNVTYNKDNTITFDIKVKEILVNEYSDDIIKDGTYTFEIYDRNYY